MMLWHYRQFLHFPVLLIHEVCGGLVELKPLGSSTHHVEPDCRSHSWGNYAPSEKQLLQRSVRERRVFTNGSSSTKLAALNLALKQVEDVAHDHLMAHSLLSI